MKLKCPNCKEYFEATGEGHSEITLLSIADRIDSMVEEMKECPSEEDWEKLTKKYPQYIGGYPDERPQV